MAVLQQMCDIEQPILLSSFKEIPLQVHPEVFSTTHEVKVNFRQASLEIDLPVVIVDDLGAQSTVYLLQYKQEGNIKDIYWREAKGSWAKISVNHWPKRIVATDGRLFLLGSLQLWIVGCDQKEKCLALEDGRVMDIAACLTETGLGGANIVYYSSRQGLFSREYSKSSYSSLWGRIRSNLHFSLKTHKEYSYFQIILAKLIAVAITTDSIAIYDLDRMQQTKCSLPFSQTNHSRKPIIKWSFSEGTDVLIIYIALGTQIYNFTLKIARLATPIQQQGEISPSFNRIARGTAIDWASSHFEKSNFENQSKKMVTDLCVFGNMLIIRQEQDLPILPIYRIINLNDSSQKYSLISFESTLWREYYLDPYTPNSFYSKFQFLLQQDNGFSESENRKRPCNETDSISYLQTCKDRAKFKHFFIFNGELYLARVGMITMFEKISNLQAVAEAYEQQQRLLDEQSKLSKQANRMGSYFQMRLDRMRRDEVEIEYKKVTAMLIKSTQTEYGQARDCIPFASKEIVGWSFLNQKMRYYSQLIQYMVKNNIISECSKKNSLINQLVLFLSGKFSKIHNSRLRPSFTRLFIKKIQSSLFDQPSLCFQSLVGKIFNNLIPHSFNLPLQGLANNQYLQFLVQSVVRSQSDLMKEDTQIEIKELISSIAPTIQDKVSFQFIRNISFVRAYLISHPPSQQLSIFSSHLLSFMASKELYKYIGSIVQYIPSQLQTIVKSELSRTRDISLELFSTEASATPTTSSQKLLEIAGGIKHSDCILSTKMDDHQRTMDALRQQGSFLIDSPQTIYSQQEQKFIFIYRSQLRLQQKRGNLQNLLQLEELALRIYIHLANRQIEHIMNIGAGQQDLQSIAKKISIIQVSFSNFCKIIRKIYAFEPAKASITYFEEVTRKMNEEQMIALTWLPSGSQLLQGKPISSLRLYVYRALFTSEAVKKPISSKCTFGAILKIHIYEEFNSSKVLSYSEIDLLSYFLYIFGENSLQSFLKGFQTSSLKNITAFYQKFELKDKILELVEPLLQENGYSDLSPVPYREHHLQ